MQVDERGDITTAFATFYEDTYLEMVRLAYVFTGSREVARDVVQDSFVRLHGKWARVDNPRAYLRQVVVNACFSHHRRERLWNRFTTSVGPGDNGHLGADDLTDAIAALPRRQQIAVVLRFWHGYNEREIAEFLGCRPGTVGSMLHRALAQLRQVIEP